MPEQNISRSLSHPFKISLLFGIPMFLTAIALQLINPVAMGNLMEGFSTPVLAFEFMQNAAETRALFQVDDPAMYRNDFMLGNTVDYLFMFFYSVFLGVTVIGVIRETGIRVLWIAVALCVLVFFSDLLENVTMASIVDGYFNGEELTASYYGNLRFFTWLKWGGLTVVFLMISGYFLRRKLLGKIVFAVICCNFGLSVFAYFYRSIANELMALTIVLLFLLVFLHNLLFKPQAAITSGS